MGAAFTSFADAAYILRYRVHSKERRAAGFLALKGDCRHNLRMKEVSDMDFNYNELPMNLGLAFASNRLAMDRFAGMSDDEKREFVERSRGILSQNEMDELVGSLAKDDEEPDLSLERVRDVFDGPEIL